VRKLEKRSENYSLTANNIDEIEEDYSSYTINTKSMLS